MAQLAVKAIPATFIDTDTLTGNYTPINPDGIPNACFTLRIINESDVIVTISYDGVTDHDVVLATNDLQLPTPINTLPNSRGACFKLGTIVYAKGAAGTGNLNLVGYYQQTP